MISLSLFSGAGGLDIGLHRAGIETAAFCEIDPKAQQVLRSHYPDIPVFDDVCTLTQEDINGPIDLVHGGSPCQDLSVAGRREGLDGDRSGLFWHQCRVADSVGAPWVIWENVLGALSSNNGADFAAVLWGLTGALPSLPVGDRWRKGGVVVGPKRTAVWRVFNAQYFGVPQRRRRVFVVAGPRNACGPEVLFESEGLFGDTFPGGPPSEIASALTATGVGTCGPDDNQAQAQARHLIPEVASTLLASDAKGPAARVESGRGNLIPVSFGWCNAPRQGDEVAYDWSCPLRTGHPPAVAFSISQNQRGEVRCSDVAPSLTTGGGKPGQGMSVAGVEEEDDGLAVRKLTPRECERLMGWPDDWTRFDQSGAEIADTNRYRMCGNGVASPVTEWIGHRVRIAHERWITA